MPALFLKEEASAFSYNQGQGALPVAHTAGRRLKREGAGKMSPSSKHYTLGAKTTESHAARMWQPRLLVPGVTFTAMTSGPAYTD